MAVNYLDVPVLLAPPLGVSAKSACRLRLEIRKVRAAADAALAAADALAGSARLCLHRGPGLPPPLCAAQWSVSGVSGPRPASEQDIRRLWQSPHSARSVTFSNTNQLVLVEDLSLFDRYNQSIFIIILIATQSVLSLARGSIFNLAPE